jgi:hypothetical protein
MEWIEEKGPAHFEQWGGWDLKRNGCLVFPGVYGKGADGCYVVDLSRWSSTADILSWIMVIAGKDWADDACVVGFIQAINDILYRQIDTCSGGRVVQFTVAEVRKQIREVWEVVRIEKASIREAVARSSPAPSTTPA